MIQLMVELKFVSMDYGVLSVVITGTMRMHQFYVTS